MPAKRSKRKNPPRRRTVAQAKGRARKRRRVRRNPSGGRVSGAAGAKEIGIQIASGFAGYAGTRLLSRAVATIVSKKSPKLAKHAGMIGSVASLGAAFFVLPAWKRTEEYAGEALIGSGIAVAQNLLRTYLPKYGWIVGDYHADIGAEKPAALPEPRGDVEEIEELPAPSPQGRAALPGTRGGTESDDDLSDILEADLGTLGYDGDNAEDALSEYGM